MVTLTYFDGLIIKLGKTCQGYISFNFGLAEFLFYNQ